MNREQAGHILDAYVRMRMRENEDESAEALREVILDAMTNCNVTTPSITWPNTQPFTTFTKPNVINNRPIVTCNTGDAQ